MLRKLLKLIVYKYSAFLNLPEHIHKYIWNVVLKKFLRFQFFKITFPKIIVLQEMHSMKTSSSRNSVRIVCIYCIIYVSCFQLNKVSYYYQFCWNNLATKCCKFCASGVWMTFIYFFDAIWSWLCSIFRYL